MSLNPYRGLPADQFWSSGVAAVPLAGLAPVRPAGFAIERETRVAALGPCFARALPGLLDEAGYGLTAGGAAPLGEISTPRQLRQMVLAAYGLHRPVGRAWLRPDGRYVDPFRPEVFEAGFDSADAVRAARRADLLALRAMLQDCAVLVLSLGQSEGWVAEDGSALPVHPGVMGVEPDEGMPSFHNFTVAEMRADMDGFLADLLVVNPAVRVVVTVSAEPLMATYEPRHVLVANAYSKAALRVVAGELEQAHPSVTYFPSYEILTQAAVDRPTWQRVLDIFLLEFTASA